MPYQKYGYHKAIGELDNLFIRLRKGATDRKERVHRCKYHGISRWQQITILPVGVPKWYGHNRLTLAVYFVPLKPVYYLI